MAMGSQEIDFIHPALDLINSGHGRALGFPDLLEQRGWLERFLRHWSYAAAGGPSERERERLVALRRLLSRIVDALDDGESPSPADLAALNRVLAARTVARELVESDGDFQLRLVTRKRDWSWVLADIAASLADLVVAGEAERIKVCDNPDCRFAFYDATKNRSRRWCAQTTCGNRHKVRQFRVRQRARPE
jgi:predicted RNA-binding Zn ribbon-like protein